MATMRWREASKSRERVHFNSGYVLEKDLALIFIQFFLDDRADRAVVTTDLTWGDGVKLDDIVTV
jgi:hypothetical protein